MSSKNKRTFLVVVLLTGCLVPMLDVVSGRPTPSAGSVAKWTAMIYMAGDNNLDPAAITDIQELESIGSSDQLQLLCLVDRAACADGYSNTRLYRITRDADTRKIGSTLVADLAELNMGDPTTLSSFLTRCVREYPAEHYLLDLWNHGSGIVRTGNEGGVCWDDTSGDYLSITEVCTVLSSFTTKLDLLTADACLMGTEEVFHDFAAVIKPGGQVVLSENNVPNSGFPYDTIFGWLAGSLDTTAEELASVIVDKYDECYGTQGHTLAALSTYACEAIASAVHEFATTVLALNETTLYEALHMARSWSRSSRNYVDLYNFMDHLVSGNPTVQAKAMDVKSAISSNIYYKGNVGVKGISIYMPLDLYYPAYNIWSSSCDEYSWDEMLDAMYNIEIISQSGDDQLEENDDLASAKTIFPFKIYSLFWKDGDYFKMALTAGAHVALYIQIAILSTRLDMIIYQESQITDWANANNNPALETLLSISGSGTIHFTVPAGDNYYIRLRYVTGDHASYTLEYIIDEDLEAGAGNDDLANAVPLSEGLLLTNLTHADDDWFAISGMPALTMIVVNVSFVYAMGASVGGSHGNLDIALFSMAGILLKSVAGKDCPKVLEFFTTDSSTYKIRVFGSDTSVLYSIRWDAIAVGDDPYEENDVQFTASTLPSTAAYSLVGLDDDWFTFTLSGGEWLDVSIMFGSDADIDLYLYNGDILVGTSATGRHVERVSYSSQIPCTVCLHVDVVACTTNYLLNYTSPANMDDIAEDDDHFAVATALSLVIDGAETEVTGVAFDPDYFSFQVTVAVDLVIDLSCMADLDVVILHVNGSVVQYMGTPGPNEVGTIRLQPGTYLLGVIPYAGTGTYTIGLQLVSVPDQTGHLALIIGLVASAAAAIMIAGAMIYRKKHPRPGS